jgi:multidrug efflux pump subunit AcrB
MRLITMNLALLVCASTLRAADDPGVVRVTARYPGASVQVVDSTVALRLLRRINGVEGATRVEAESTKDGTCTITVRLDAKADPATIQALVRKRVALAEPVIPEPCKRGGITVRTEPARTAEFWFALTRPDDPGDATLLANFAREKYTHVLHRIPGVGEVRVLGTADSLLRITLDREKLRARNLTLDEVRAALYATNDVNAISTIDPPPKGSIRLMVRSSGRLKTIADAPGGVVIKAGENGQKVLLRDLGQVEHGPMTPNELTTFDGKPAALLAVTANRDTTLEQIEGAFELLRKAPPRGVQFTTVVTPTTPRVLLLEVRVPDSRTMEYTQTVCERVTKAALAWNGGLPAVAFTDRLQPNGASLLVTCKPDADAAVLQKRLAGEIREAAIRVCDVTGGKPAFPVRIALAGPDPETVRKWSEAILTRAGKDGIVGDVADWPGRDLTQPELIFDNEKAKELGIDLAKALEFISETRAIKDGKPEDLKDLFVKDAKGQMISFSEFATMKQAVDPAPIYRFGLDRAMRITANPANGKSVADCAERLRALAESEKASLKLTTGYRAVSLIP